LKKLYELQLQCVARYNYIERKESWKNYMNYNV